MVGVDAAWREETQERIARYNNLRPGKYRFEVVAANRHNVWSLQPAKFEFFKFTFGPFFWQTWPFYVFCACVVFGLAVTFHTYRLRWQRRLLKLDVQHALASERTRIARDLHDDLGADLTGLALRLDVVRNQSPPSAPVQDALANVARDARGLVDNMREAVWATNPDYDDVESLADFLAQYTENYLQSAGLRCRLELPAQAAAHPLSSHARHQLFLAVKEALHNVVRHAQASEVQFRIEQEQNELRLVVADNGRGLPLGKIRPSERGLDNVEKRVTAIGGKFSVTSAANEGTRITITVPLGGNSPSHG
jgi:signal transduction histidine kinase